MKKWISLIALAINLSLFSEEASQFEKITGLNGSYNEDKKVFKASFPRTDVKVSVDGWTLDPFMGLTSWTSFIQINENHFMVMGDLVLFQDEVNAVMTSLLNHHLDVTALHNHFFYDNPKVYFMHIKGKGTLKELANGVRAALETEKEIRSKNPIPSHSFGGPAIPIKSAIDSAKLEKILNTQSQNKEGMTKFVFGRSIEGENVEIGADMGINTWAAFGGTNDNAIVDGDFAVLENELKFILKALRDGGINIVAIHNHMTEELPRMLFLHYWGKGNAEELAKTIKLALSHTKIN